MHGMQRLQTLSCRLRHVPLQLASQQLPSLTDVCDLLRNAHRLYNSDSHADEQTNLQQLLKYWQGLLGNEDHPHVARSNQAKSSWRNEDIKNLLHTAIRVRHGRLSGVLPEQLLSTFVQVYQKTTSPKDRLKLFQILCEDFGVQGE